MTDSPEEPKSELGFKPRPKLQDDVDVSPGMLYIPETMKNWPWPRSINPYYEEASRESSAWIKSFKPFNERSQYAFDLCDLGRLAALAYPNVSREHLRTGVDLMNLVFVVEEYTDAEPYPVVSELIRTVIDAIQDPSKPRPEGETILGEIARQFWERGERLATPDGAKHFVEAITDCLESLVVQASDRDDGRIRTVDEYFQMRRDNVGARTAYAMGGLNLSIPDHVFYHPVIKELEQLIADLLVIDNDILSYNKEQAMGDDRHNIITVVMHQYNLSLPEAMRWACTQHEEVEAKFLDVFRRELPSWGTEIDEQVGLYMEYVTGWPRANECWSFESGRYFGSRGLEVQKTRVVPLLPKVVQR